MQKIKSINLENSGLFAKGKRGLVYVSEYYGRKIAVKVKNPASKAIERIENESIFLKKLNKYGIGPEFIYFHDGHLGMEFIDGKKFEDFIDLSDKLTIRNVIINLIDDLLKMDELGINKEEMHHPVKHIIVTEKGKPVLLDFERCHYTKKPKNITQFLQYLSGANISRRLNAKGFAIEKERLILLSRMYKQGTAKRSDLLAVLD